MTRLLVAMESTLLAVSGSNGTWQATPHPFEGRLECVTVDPGRPERAYCGTYERGLWRSDDAGATWRRVGAGSLPPAVMSVAVSPIDRRGGYGVVWAGTEPSSIFRSEDGGETWRECPALKALPSAPTWSYPPRPWTSHVRWIVPDPTEPARVFASIELGGIMRSLDGGATWEDRRDDTPLDAHTLYASAAAPGRVVTANGDGFMAAGNGCGISRDGGTTWQRLPDGLQHHYLWSVAADPANPDNVVITGASSPMAAHRPPDPESHVYQRQPDGPWAEARAGLPEPRGTIVPVVASSPSEPGVFYLTSNHGVYRSADGGATWQHLDLAWPDACRTEHPQAIVVAG